MNFNLRTKESKELFKDYLLMNGFKMVKAKKERFKKGKIIVVFDYINIAIYDSYWGIFYDTEISEKQFNEITTI